MFMVVSAFLYVSIFNAQATTKTYTYWHTLSLHDALPIYGLALVPEDPGILDVRAELEPGLEVLGGEPAPVGQGHDILAPIEDDQVTLLVRSEEHTSEFQSLMRISYAVVYLKKKERPLPPEAHLRHCHSTKCETTVH